MTPVDFDKKVSARLEAVYSSADIVRRRDLVRAALGVKSGHQVLDIGCGPGFFVAELAQEVGEDGLVTGVDTAEAMVNLTEQRISSLGNARCVIGDASSLPFGDGEFDRAFTVQVLEYVPDVPAAIREIRRVLRPGGRLVIWDVDWATLSLRTADAPRMQRMLDAWDQHLAHPSLPRELTGHLAATGFEQVQMQAHVFATNTLEPDAYGGFLVPFLKSFVVDNDLVDEADAAAWANEQQELNTRGEFYCSVTQVCFTAERPA